MLVREPQPVSSENSTISPVPIISDRVAAARVEEGVWHSGKRKNKCLKAPTKSIIVISCLARFDGVSVHDGFMKLLLLVCMLLLLATSLIGGEGG